MLHAVATDVQGRYPDLTIETSVTAGDPAGVLVEESRTASLVVVGSRGLGGIRGMLAGSVSAQVAAHAHAPVIVVRPPAADDPEPDRAGTGVVIGVDGSPGSTAALEFAFEEAEAHGNRLVAVYAWATPPTTNLGPITDRHFDPVEAQQEADRVLAEVLAGWQEKHPDVAVERRAVYSLNPLDTLLTESRDAAVIVVGPRGRGGFAGLLLGSVSDGLVRHAHRPVAVVHLSRSPS
jgi:nucleotide-binding universal stress UspA family protein